ncbi:MAG: hypothetical protein N2044_01180 [Cyclobacteriaceae bacterium]|nr:hypothetical protein [Cyclobacteriaceae bacterium]MCX7636435.1 hypothetical protein [Cyclobacteriaceae bacterium]MDW8330754.1 hypothetical protein [Cyclobacteriaceae bacterium]
MEQIRLFSLLLAATAFLLLILGFYRPWVVLWWEDVQNRRKVLHIYGTIGMGAMLIYFLLGLF